MGLVGDDGPNIITGIGSIGVDYIDGGRGDDTLAADSDGGNSIYGGEGDDYLEGGGSGVSYLDGGPGTDTCVDGDELVNCEA